MLVFKRLLRGATTATGSQLKNLSSSAAAATEKRLQGRVALVTGAANGIGAATAKLFVEHGAKVLIADIDDQQGTSLASSLSASSSSSPSSSPSCIYLHCDVTNEEHIKVAVDTAVSTYGRLDVMHSNAGVLVGTKPSSSITSMDASDLDYVYRVNVRGAALGMKHAARVMVGNAATGGGGSIICTASVASTVAGLALHPYTTSKHALVGLVKSCACELAHYGVRVNCVSPNGVLTGLARTQGRFLRPAAAAAAPIVVAGGMFSDPVDLRRMLEPCDIARAALFLASDESKFVSGHNLVVDGSFTASAAMNLYKFLKPDEVPCSVIQASIEVSNRVLLRLQLARFTLAL